MKISDRLMPIAVGGFILFGVGVTVMRVMSPESTTVSGIIEPALTPLAASGKVAFDANCAQCHGNNAAGGEQGPPLIHDTYNPGHHADEAFFRAAKQGVPQHHWAFGNMPAKPETTNEQLTSIVRYIREMQEANGIFYRPHTM